MRLNRKSKTIYLSGNRYSRKQRKTKTLLMGILGVGALIGVGLGFLPNAYEITIDGEVIAIVDKKEYIDEALETVETQLKNQYKTEVKLAEIESIKKVHASKKELIDPNKLSSYLKAELPIELEFQRLLVDGKEIGIIESEDALEELKTQLKRKYFRDTEVEAEFVNDVELEPVFTTEDQLTDMDELVDIATERHKEVIQYTVASGDSLWIIADKLGVNMLDIISENEGMTETPTLQIGQVINVEVKVPVLGLELIEPEVETEGEGDPAQTEGEDVDA